ncbi:cytochrome P450, partial [Mycolicibacterium pulveris]
MTVTSTAPSVFDADLPSFSYTLTASPHDILEDVRSAQARAPIA